MARPNKSRMLDPVTSTEKLHPDDLEREFAKLKAKVDFLWKTVEFMGHNPHYKIGDYFAEHADELRKLEDEA